MREESGIETGAVETGGSGGKVRSEAVSRESVGEREGGREDETDCRRRRSESGVAMVGVD